MKLTATETTTSYRDNTTSNSKQPQQITSSHSSKFSQNYFTDYANEIKKIKQIDERSDKYLKKFLKLYDEALNEMTSECTVSPNNSEWVLSKILKLFNSLTKKNYFYTWSWFKRWK